MIESLAIEMARAVRSDARADWKTPFKTLAFVCAHPILAWEWSRRLVRPPLRSLWPLEPRLIDKPLRPYLNASWSVSQRLAAIELHYEWLADRFSPAVRERFFSAGTAPFELARWSLGTGAPAVCLQIGYCGSFEREGDLTLMLAVEHGPANGSPVPWVVALTFGVAMVDSVHSLCIGCIQARQHESTLSLLAAMTRAQYGLRPKSLLILVAQKLARHWRLQPYGIDPEHHPFASFRYQMSRSKRKTLEVMRISYESLWLDAHGVRHTGGWWRLPIDTPGRALEHIPARKRGMYAKRHEWLRFLEVQLDHSIQQIEQR